jgi:hypothetical protein
MVFNPSLIRASWLGQSSFRWTDKLVPRNYVEPLKLLLFVIQHRFRIIIEITSQDDRDRQIDPQT